MKRIKMGGLNVLLLFAHNAPSEQHTPTRGVIWYVQSYLVLHLHAKKRLATNKQNARTQRRSLKEDGVASIEVIEATTTPQNGGNCHYLISFVLSV